MNWICTSCGYENEYNDESRPTECQCCGETASEEQLNQAKHALEEYHKEKERQRQLEQLRLEKIRRQKIIDNSVKRFIMSLKTLATACIVLVVFSVVFVGFNTYKGIISPKNITNNVKSITIMDNVIVSEKEISECLSKNALEYNDNIIQNVSHTAKSRKYTVIENLKILKEEKKESILATISVIKRSGTDFQKGYENLKDNSIISRANISDGGLNLTVNLNMFWKQTIENINQLVDSITKKVVRSK